MWPVCARNHSRASILLHAEDTPTFTAQPNYQYALCTNQQGIWTCNRRYRDGVRSGGEYGLPDGETATEDEVNAAQDKLEAPAESAPQKVDEDGAELDAEDDVVNSLAELSM